MFYFNFSVFFCFFFFFFVLLQFLPFFSVVLYLVVVIPLSSFGSLNLYQMKNMLKQGSTLRHKLLALIYGAFMGAHVRQQHESCKTGV